MSSLSRCWRKLPVKAGSPVSARQKLFKTKDANCALTSACRRLNLPHFSQRKLRKCLIRRRGATLSGIR
jgi:hypothetical protein